MEKTIVLDNTDIVGIYGKNNNNLELLCNIYPQLKFTARGNELKIAGADNLVEEFEKRFQLLIVFYEQFGQASSFLCCRAKTP